MMLIEAMESQQQSRPPVFIPESQYEANKRFAQRHGFDKPTMTRGDRRRLVALVRGKRKANG